MNESVGADIFCSFCEEKYQSTEAIVKHLMTCGNKTDECPKCHKYIRRAIFVYHYENDCANLDESAVKNDVYGEPVKFDTPRLTIKCEYCNENYDRNDKNRHQNTCHEKWVNIDNRQQHHSDEHLYGNLDQLTHFNDPEIDNTRIPCEYCSQGIEWDNYERHIKACQDDAHRKLMHRRRRTDHEQTITTNNTTSTTTFIMSRNNNLPCIFCKRLMSLAGILYHQQDLYMAYAVDFDDRQKDTVRASVCMFCDDKMPQASMHEHLLTCGNKTDECPRCRKFIRRAVFTYHYENSCINPDEFEDKTNVTTNQLDIPIQSSSIPIVTKGNNITCVTLSLKQPDTGIPSNSRHHCS
ncbi:hypothetical protein I4U23_001951 [Adineta vaga]|nr:hypothetical protein I4U23_001951 [Adineta vaga]